MSLSKQQAIDIIERDPVGGAQFYSPTRCEFYSKYDCDLYVYKNEGWDLYVPDSEISVLSLIPMHELLAIAEGKG